MAKPRGGTQIGSKPEGDGGIQIWPKFPVLNTIEYMYGIWTLLKVLLCYV